MQQIWLICKELPLLFLILPQMTLTLHLKTQIHLQWFIVIVIVINIFGWLFTQGLPYLKPTVQATVLQGWVNVKKLVIIYSTSHVWFGDRSGGGGRQPKAKNFTPPPPPPPYSLFLTINCPLETNFSPQYSTAIKLKDCHHNFPLRKYWVISCQNSTCSAGYPNPQFYIISGPPAFSIRGLIWLNECPPTLSF